MAIANSASSPAPWHAAYPAPRNSQPEAIRREDVLEIMKLGQNKAGKDYVLVDLRRNDHEGGTIHGSINLPAQNLYPTIPTLYAIFKAAGLSKIIWYCCTCLTILVTPESTGLTTLQHLLKDGAPELPAGSLIISRTRKMNRCRV